MSFSEQLLNPDNLSEGMTRYEEMHPEKIWKKLKAVDGEEVWDTLQTIADRKENEKEKDRSDRTKPNYDFEWARTVIAQNSHNEMKAKKNDHPTAEEILAQFQGSSLWEARTAEWAKKDNIA